MQIETKYPAGAITHKDDLQAAIDQARAEHTSVMLYRVGQSGYVEEIEIVSASSIFTTDHGSLFLGYKSQYGEHMTETSLLDAYIPPNRYNDHFFFTNHRHAEQYSRFVEKDPAHIKAVRDHHEFCNVLGDLFDDLEMLFDDDYPNDD